MNIIRVGYLSGGNTLMVNVESGAVVSATNGTKTVTGVSVDGLCKLRVQAGTWTVIATKGSDVSQPVDVVVTDSYSREMSFGLPVSGLPVGALIKTNLNGAGWNFRIVHQGLPSSMYDASCNGTWLLMNDIYENRQWHSSDVNDYENSAIHSYLNSIFLGLFDANIQSAIKQVKLPYRKGSGYRTTITSGASGLAAKIFLLSGAEVNWSSNTSNYIPNDGACLSYFSGCATTDSKRIAKLNGSAARWWLRSPYCNSSGGSTFALYVLTDGSWSYNYCSKSSGVRPALILPSDAMYNPTPNADGSYTLIA